MLFPTFVFTNCFIRQPVELLMSSSTSGPRDVVDIGVLEEPPRVGPYIKGTSLLHPKGIYHHGSPRWSVVKLYDYQTHARVQSLYSYSLRIQKLNNPLWIYDAWEVSSTFHVTVYQGQPGLCQWKPPFPT